MIPYLQSFNLEKWMEERNEGGDGKAAGTARKSKFQGDTAKFGAYLRIKRKKKRGETSSSVKNRKKYRAQRRGGKGGGRGGGRGRRR